MDLKKLARRGLITPIWSSGGLLYRNVWDVIAGAIEKRCLWGMLEWSEYPLTDNPSAHVASGGCGRDFSFPRAYENGFRN